MCFVVGEKGVRDYYHPKRSKRFCCHDKDMEFQETANSCITTCDKLKGRTYKSLYMKLPRSQLSICSEDIFFPFLSCLQTCLFKNIFQKNAIKYPAYLYSLIKALGKHKLIISLNIKVDEKKENDTRRIKSTD